MTFSAHGLDGFLLVIAAICFLIAAIVGWLRAGHRAVLVLISGGLFLWVLTALVH